ncbi:hypothetical protein CQW23_16059 [Capsicum baccatum]|uniref:ribonuclease Z n=1 Tax=Capsicum baccatum TaxID=33114 RepID=A0A2G2WNW0_CAPBA|nr:hypothetical protein CQW23_16059 [Capsicum baccatum]
MHESITRATTMKSLSRSITIKHPLIKNKFDALPQIAKDFTAGFNLYENELPHMGPFLLESAAYKTMLLIANKDDYHYRLNMDSLFTNGIIDNLIRCCRVRHWTSLRIQAVETFHIFIRRGTTAQNEELLRHAVVPCLMQMLNDEDAIDLDDDDWLDDNVIVEGSACGIFAENLLKFTLRPPRDMGLDRSSVENLTTSSVFIEELLSEIPEIADAAKNISKFWHKPKDEVELSNRQDSGDVVTEEPSKFSAPRCLENVQRDDLEIVFLGTGSSVPSKYRNVSSIHVNLFSKGGLLLDCGEGTLAQLKRRYGIIGADGAVRNLKCIWISHIHADHHAGVARILALRRDLLKGVAHDPILVIGPKQVGEFLMEYIKLEDLDMLFLDCKSTTVAAWDNMEADSMYVESRDHTLLTSLSEDGPLQHCSKKMKLSTPVDDITLLKCFRKVLSEAGLVRFISFPVVHCPDTEAFGVILESAERMNHDKVVPGWKVVYSGDTRPCSQVIEASLGATILIHEATFEDGLVEEAIARNHSTIKEAIEVGDSAGAYRVILTHFIQRYPKVPALDEVSMQTTCIAFDLMSVNLADLPVLPKVLPYLKLLFRNSG